MGIKPSTCKCAAGGAGLKQKQGGVLGGSQLQGSRFVSWTHEATEMSWLMQVPGPGMGEASREWGGI